VSWTVNTLVIWGSQLLVVLMRARLAQKAFTAQIRFIKFDVYSSHGGCELANAS